MAKFHARTLHTQFSLKACGKRWGKVTQNGCSTSTTSRVDFMIAFADTGSCRDTMIGAHIFNECHRQNFQAAEKANLQWQFGRYLDRQNLAVRFISTLGYRKMAFGKSAGRACK